MVENQSLAERILSNVDHNDSKLTDESLMGIDKNDLKGLNADLAAGEVVERAHQATYEQEADKLIVEIDSLLKKASDTDKIALNEIKLRLEKKWSNYFTHQRFQEDQAKIKEIQVKVAGKKTETIASSPEAPVEKTLAQKTADFLNINLYSGWKAENKGKTLQEILSDDDVVSEVLKHLDSVHLLTMVSDSRAINLSGADRNPLIKR